MQRVAAMRTSPAAPKALTRMERYWMEIIDRGNKAKRALVLTFRWPSSSNVFRCKLRVKTNEHGRFRENKGHVRHAGKGYGSRV